LPALKVWNGTSWDVISGPPGPTGATGSQGPGGGNFNLTLSGNTAGAMAQVSSGTLTLAGGNGVVLSQNGNAITISASNSLAAMQLAGNTAGVMATLNSGTVQLAGGANITLSQNAQSITILGQSGTRSMFLQTFGQSFHSANAATGGLTLQPLQVEWNLTATEMDWLMIASNINTAASTFTLSASGALYSWVNSTSLGLATSGSISYSWATTNSSLYNGFRQWSMPFNAYMTPGDYVAALWLRTAGGNASMSLLGESLPATGFGGWAGAVSATSQREFPGFGVYSASFSSAMPAGIGPSNIAGNASSARQNDLIFRALGA
jgi:hypothetical protein